MPAAITTAPASISKKLVLPNRGVWSTTDWVAFLVSFFDIQKELVGAK
jgi:hypothetical protein